MSEAKLTQVSLSHSTGGKVQIQKYVEDSNYFVSEQRQFSIPEDWDEAQVENFILEQREHLRAHVDQLGQIERDERAAQSDTAV